MDRRGSHRRRRRLGVLDRFVRRELNILEGAALSAVDPADLDGEVRLDLVGHAEHSLVDVGQLRARLNRGGVEALEEDHSKTNCNPSTQKWAGRGFKKKKKKNELLVNNLPIIFRRRRCLLWAARPKILGVTDYKLICPLGSKLLPDRSLCQAQSGWVCHRSGCLSLPHWLRDQPRYALIRSGAARFHRVLACSGWVQRELAAAGIDSEVDDAARSRAVTPVARRPLPDPTILYCGRLDQTKGVDLLLRAFARLSAEFPAACLRIAGAGRRAPLLGAARRLTGPFEY